MANLQYQATTFNTTYRRLYNYSDIHDEEIRTALAISHGVFTVIGFLAVSECENTNSMYKEAMELARNLDESTGNMLNLINYFKRR